MTPGEPLNEQRQREASQRDVVIARQIIAVPAVYQQLTTEQRKVLVKRIEMAGASWAQIAAVLGLSKAAAWYRWRRALSTWERFEPEVSEPDLWRMGG